MRVDDSGDTIPCRITGVTLGNATPCRMTGVTLHGVASPEAEDSSLVGAVNIPIATIRYEDSWPSGEA